MCLMVFTVAARLVVGGGSTTAMVALGLLANLKETREIK
jgi:hypothetical protein